MNSSSRRAVSPATKHRPGTADETGSDSPLILYSNFVLRFLLGGLRIVEK